MREPTIHELSLIAEDKITSHNVICGNFTESTKEFFIKFYGEPIIVLDKPNPTLGQALAAAGVCSRSEARRNGCDEPIPPGINTFMYGSPKNKVAIYTFNVTNARGPKPTMEVPHDTEHIESKEYVFTHLDEEQEIAIRETPTLTMTVAEGENETIKILAIKEKTNDS